MKRCQTAFSKWKAVHFLLGFVLVQPCRQTLLGKDDRFVLGVAVKTYRELPVRLS